MERADETSARGVFFEQEPGSQGKALGLLKGPFCGARAKAIYPVPGK